MRLVFLYSNHHLAQTTAQPGIAYKLALAAQEAGHEVLIISNVASGFIPENKRISFYLIPGAGDLTTYLIYLFGIIRKINSFNTDLIHVHGDMFYLYITWLLPFIRRPVTVYVCETLTSHSKFTQWIYTIALRQAKRIFVSCFYIGNELRRGGIDEVKIITVRLGLADKYLKIKRLTQESFDVLYFGDSTIVRGFDVVVKVAEKLKRRRFLCLLRYRSSDCPEIMNLASRCRNLEIKYFPYDEPLEEILAQTKIVLLPFREQMGVRPPLTVVESMAVGANVVTSDIGGMNEIISSEKNGYLVKNWVTDRYILLIENILKNPQRLKEVGLMARKEVRLMFSQEEYRKALVELEAAGYGSKIP